MRVLKYAVPLKTILMVVKSFIEQAFGVGFIKHSWSRFTHSFYEQEHFTTYVIFSLSTLGRSSFQKRVSKFTPKNLMRLTSCCGAAVVGISGSWYKRQLV
jgi:hypothetical protein